MVIKPKLSPHAGPDDISRDWKSDKNYIDAEAIHTMESLNMASKFRKGRPPNMMKDFGRSDMRKYLPAAHGHMKGWAEYYEGPEGKRFDPDGRRWLSATQRATNIENLYKDLQVMHKPAYDPFTRRKNWEKMAKMTIPNRLERTKQEYKTAVDMKHLIHRTGYGSYVKHEISGDGGKVAFESSKDAKARKKAEAAKKAEEVKPGRKDVVASSSDLPRLNINKPYNARGRRGGTDRPGRVGNIGTSLLNTSGAPGTPNKRI